MLQWRFDLTLFEDLLYHSWKSPAGYAPLPVTIFRTLLTTSILDSILLTSSSFLQYPVLSLAAFVYSSHLGIHICISQRPILQALLIPHLFHVIHPNKFARNCLPLLSFHAPCRDWINIFLIKLNWVRVLIAICLALVICMSISSLWISRGQDSICFKFTSLQLLSLLCTWEFNK